MPRYLTEQDIADFRAELCKVATERFAKNGYEGVTMRQLAEALGCSPKTPYRYFKDKADILATVRAQAFGRFADALQAAAEQAAGDDPVYGVNTGFGKLANQRISTADLDTLQLNLIRSHAVGVGAPMSPEVVRLMLATKAASLARGYSGVRGVVAHPPRRIRDAGRERLDGGRGVQCAQRARRLGTHRPLGVVECPHQRGDGLAHAQATECARRGDAQLEVRCVEAACDGTAGRATAGEAEGLDQRALEARGAHAMLERVHELRAAGGAEAAEQARQRGEWSRGEQHGVAQDPLERRAVMMARECARGGEADVLGAAAQGMSQCAPRGTQRQQAEALGGAFAARRIIVVAQHPALEREVRVAEQRACESAALPVAQGECRGLECRPERLGLGVGRHRAQCLGGDLSGDAPEHHAEQAARLLTTMMPRPASGVAHDEQRPADGREDRGAGQQRGRRGGRGRGRHDLRVIGHPAEG